MKSVLDSTLLTVGATALLYFSGLIYYYSFFVLLGIPATEFLPPTQTVIARSAAILIIIGQEHILVAVSVFIFLLFVIFIKLLSQYVMKVSQIKERIEKLINPLIGWPGLLILASLYLGFIYRSGEMGISDADSSRTSIEAASITIYLKTEIKDKPNPVSGRFIAESLISYAIADNDRKGAPLIIPKNEVLRIESTGPNIGI